MANEPVATVIGNLAADPELRFTPSGAAVANVTVASTPRTFNKDTNQWEDGETLWMRGSVWRDYAEHVAESLHKGDRVIMHGKIVMRSYEKDGQNRSVVEMHVDEIGPCLRYASAHVTKAERVQASAPQQGGDPWSTATPAQAPAWGQPQGNPTQQGQQPLPPGQPQQGPPPGWTTAPSEPPF